FELAADLRPQLAEARRHLLLAVEERRGRLHAVLPAGRWVRRTNRVPGPGRLPRGTPGIHRTRSPDATRGREPRSAAGTPRAIRKRRRLISRPAVSTRSPGRRVRTARAPSGAATTADP